MIIVDKQNQVIQDEYKTVSYREFMKELCKKNTEIRVGVYGDKKLSPYDLVFFKVDRSEILETVRSFKMEVTYTTMYNSKVDPKLKDTIYIKKLKQTLV